MKYLVQESAQVRLIAENGRAKLFELVKTDIEWGGFVVALKKATSKKIEFKVGWNGYRLASDAPLEKLKLIDYSVYEWLLSALKELRPHVASDLEIGVKARNVQYLTHFTPLENLTSILRRGIYPRSMVDKVGDAVFCDALRLDGHLDASCLSISFPNDKMFYKCRNTIASKGWVVMLLNPSILWSKKVAFMKTNAANAFFRNKSVQSFFGFEAFESLFKESSLGPARLAKNLQRFDPTDVQAEVLVFQVIKPQLIEGLVFENDKDLSFFLQILKYENSGKFKFFVDPTFFSNREYARKNCPLLILES